MKTVRMGDQRAAKWTPAARRLTTPLIASCLVLAGCGTTSRLDGNVGAHSDASVGVNRGEPADFTAYLYNGGSQPVTLGDATLIKLKGLPVATLVHTAVQVGRFGIISARGWPVAGKDAVPLSGYRLEPHQTAAVIYSVSSETFGNYAAEGVRVSVTSGGRSEEIDVAGPSGVCVKTGHDPGCAQSFDAVLDADVRR